MASALRTRNWSERVRNEETGSAKDDSGLREVRERSGELNARVHSALGNIPVPEGLRARILASNKIVRVPFWRTPRALALAAAMVVLATGLIFFATVPREDQSFAGFRNRMVGFALREYRMDIFTNDLSAVQQYLASKGTPSELKLPQTLAQAPVKGGAALSWQGKPVSMVCFERLNTTVYMFVVDKPTGAVEFAHQALPDKGVSTAAWTAGGKTYFLAAKLPQAELEQLVPVSELEAAAKS
jgi:anti-sigma factor RsiW